MSPLPNPSHPSSFNLNTFNPNSPTPDPDRLTPTYLATASPLANFPPSTLPLTAHNIVIITNPETPPPPPASDPTIGNDQLGAALLTLVLALAIIAL